MSNHLAGQSSPYLLQHAENPVEWYPWGDDAFRLARDKQRPIFLSVGYSACHWCHVMEHESFTDVETADYLNRHFVSVKVDREERPDIDTIYMEAVAALTGQGGWPLSVWLTPEGAPFYGGTYFPPRPRFGRPSFRQILEAIVDVWNSRQGDIRQTADRIREHLARETPVPDRETPSAEILAGATKNLLHTFDAIHGGWGEAPKFPQPLVLEYLLAQQSLLPRPDLERLIAATLDAMASGGIYDHLAGGFHRYATDEAWLIPHFEKMLYDNAQLARCYLHAWQATGKASYRRLVEQTLGYLLRSMSHPQGGFYSAEDADSEGREGAFYVWTPEQIREVLSPAEARLAEATYGVTSQGNFEGSNVLHLPGGPAEDDAALETIRTVLLSAREERPRPARDEKVLCGWNGVALAAFSEAARALRSERLLDAATKTGYFMTREFLHDGDRLLHTWKDGRASGNGLLEDYACTIEGLLSLYQTSFDERWFTIARDLLDALIAHFRRPSGGFFDTSDDHESLIIRPRTAQDSPTPSGNAMAATVLLKMAAYTGESRYSDLAEETLATAATFLREAPTMAGQWLHATFLFETGLTRVAIVGDLADPTAEALLAVIGSSLRPGVVVGARSTGSTSALSILRDREPRPETPAAAWVCTGSSCSAPTCDPAELEVLLAPAPQS